MAQRYIYSNMSDLGKDLRNYLSKSETNESTASLIPGSIRESKIGKWFNGSRKDDPTENGSGWFAGAESDPYLPKLSKTQRVIGFVGLLAMGIFCFVMASFYAPFLVLKARKFALLYSLGSLFFIFSFALLWGPANHMRHLFSMERMPFTTVYFGTMLATLYFSLWVKSTIMTIICAILQIIALIWFLVSYIPGGQTGLKFFTKIFTKTVSKGVSSTLPV